ncbi:hypothetical protein GJI78_08365 [Lactococcus lactis subsp. cremoris]|uniref:Prophage pi3 protein 02 n=2 Tax=Lactococcus lactis subsp. lactis TaxID=1360 RepID=Q9CFT9_LACLA|nr:prophage pi3 protein 02 [Lactococcus lactis subsp. lactis Il1403]AWJ95534.1 hypothetical protein P620_13875 [Lactococcus lactis subsp. lactis KLDS 4.0325]AYV50915.1 hypothetical protein EFD52_06470 [Lactococcus lactis]MBG1278636.1 hypothetical protein [Lactococcus lactis subsp. lactis]MRL88063.1 hypothetical protein [Lactococcus cremoris]RKO32251.1 hypothetical protein D8M10_07105 [Lactococcus lactis subsp. lactis bv. diacetylactis]
MEVFLKEFLLNKFFIDFFYKNQNNITIKTILVTFKVIFSICFNSSNFGLRYSKKKTLNLSELMHLVTFMLAYFLIQV